LPTRAIPGVGPKTAQRLAGAGLETCGQLADAPRETLAHLMGRHGESLRRRAKGIDDRPVAPRQPHRKSISRETTFPGDVGDADVLAATISSLAHSVAGRMRHRGLAARTVTVKLRWSDFTTLTRQTTLPFPTDREADVAREAERLWRGNWPRRRRVRLIGVGVSNLGPADGLQLPLDLGASEAPPPTPTVRPGPRARPTRGGDPPPDPRPGARPGSRGP
ncbi:MAG: helix-hairpin-helix domain-containing protein, partial [Anaerolineae bacterium]